MNHQELEDLFGYGIVEIKEVLEDHGIDIEDDEAIRLLVENFDTV
jgi:hypothetical protein